MRQPPKPVTILCVIEGCEKFRRRQSSNARPWCHRHYARWRLYGNPEEPSHQRQRGDCTAAGGCDKKAYAYGRCPMHAARVRKHGNETTILRVQPRLAHITAHGYILVKRWDHPNAQSNGYIQEHRLVMSEMLGRPLYPDENVHHRNGNKTDNSPENLELWVKSQPPGQRVAELVTWAKEILRRYESGGAHDVNAGTGARLAG